MTIKGVRDEIIVGSKGIKIKTQKKVKLGLNWVLQIKGVGRDSDRQRR